jgi:hypothetical protein
MQKFKRLLPALGIVMGMSIATSSFGFGYSRFSNGKDINCKFYAQFLHRPTQTSEGIVFVDGVAGDLAQGLTLQFDFANDAPLHKNNPFVSEVLDYVKSQSPSLSLSYNGGTVETVLSFGDYSKKSSFYRGWSKDSSFHGENFLSAMQAELPIHTLSNGEQVEFYLVCQPDFRTKR